MVAGELKCLGPLQHLKNRFGTGFYLTLKMAPNADLSRVLGAIRNQAAGSRVEGLEMDVLGEHSSTVSLWVKKGASLGHLFTWMESPIIKGLVVDYGINQPSLEQVFLGFARKAEAEANAETAV